MTVQCYQCKAEIGEKCSKCGAPLKDFRMAGSRRLYMCTPCQTYIFAGEGGVSHGLCPGCYETTMQDLRREVLGEQNLA